MPHNLELAFAQDRRQREELLVKIIRTLAACAIAGSALVGSVSLAAATIGSAAPTAAVAGATNSLQHCPNGTTIEYGNCLPL
jgi:hypothetical protein